MGKNLKKAGKALRDNALNLVIFSMLTGLCVGVFITFYNIAVTYAEQYAVNFYAAFLSRPALIPFLFIFLAAGAIIIGTIVKAVPMIRGSGIPQTEGAARGTIVFKWYITLISMLACSLACVCLGLNAGAEGPSLEMGGCVGDAVGAAFKRTQMTRRLQIAAGASAGLAVAFNAPITGMVFALEEAFHSFSMQVFISAAVSVISALIVRNAIRTAIGLSATFSLTSFSFATISVSGFLYVLIAAIIVSLLGVGFYYLVFALKKLFSHVRFLFGTGKYIIAFVIMGAFGLLSAYSMGGGHTFLEALGTGGTGEYNITQMFSLGVFFTIFLVSVMKFVASALDMGCGVPCGVFIPMLATGAGFGAALSIIFQKAGMDPSYSDYLVIICMATFFTCIVKAPITGIVMCFELTGTFSNSLPVLIGITVGYLIGELCRTHPIYERSLELFIKEENAYKGMKKEKVSAYVRSGSSAEGCRIRKVIWPTNGLVTNIIYPDGKSIVPDGETILLSGVQIVFECDTTDEKYLLKYITEITGDKEAHIMRDAPPESMNKI